VTAWNLEAGLVDKVEWLTVFLDGETNVFQFEHFRSELGFEV